MQGANATNILYLAFRLGPFIVVSSLILQSILKWDPRGLVYLIGLLIAYSTNMFLSKQVAPQQSGNQEQNPKCGIISLGERGNTLSSLPLSIAVYSYTFFYMLTFILYQNAAEQNIPTLVFFPLLIFMETMWIIVHSCAGTLYTIASLIAAGIVGIGWSAFLIYLNKPGLAYVSNGNLDVCSRPQKTYFRCTPNH